MAQGRSARLTMEIHTKHTHHYVPNYSYLQTLTSMLGEFVCDIATSLSENVLHEFFYSVPRGVCMHVSVTIRLVTLRGQNWLLAPLYGVSGFVFPQPDM